MIFARHAFCSAEYVFEEFAYLFLTFLGIAGVATLIYKNRWPECLYPGKFDVFGSSHQIWHVLTAIACTLWLYTTLRFTEVRKDCPFWI